MIANNVVSSCMDKLNQTSQTCKVVEDSLEKTRALYRQNQKMSDEELRKVRDLQLERDNLKMRLFYMTNAKQDICCCHSTCHREG